MEQPQILSLVFVYNADAGLGNAIIGGAHKLISPSTYECKLCGLTYGIVGQKNAWKKFRKHCPLPMEFLYRDEFSREYASKFGARYTYPIILAITAKGMEVLVGTGELNSLDAVGELIRLLEKRIDA